MPLVAADVAWMLMATALVLPMTPALGFFYGGLSYVFLGQAAVTPVAIPEMV